MSLLMGDTDARRLFDEIKSTHNSAHIQALDLFSENELETIRLIYTHYMTEKSMSRNMFRMLFRWYLQRNNYTLIDEEAKTSKERLVTNRLMLETDGAFS